MSAAPHAPSDKPVLPSTAFPQRITLAIATTLLLLAPCSRAGESSPSQPDVRMGDLRLTVFVRRTLFEDPELARYNLGVSVRQGVATVWGPVPTEALARRARERLRQVLGIVEVRSELYPGTVEDSPGKQPSGVEPGFLLSTPRVHGALAARTGSSPSVAEVADTSATTILDAGGPRDTPSPSLHEAVTLMPPLANRDVPTPVAKEPTAVLLTPTPFRAPADLASEVVKLQQRDGRFGRLRAEVRDGVVYLRGTVRRSEDLMELAQVIALLPGIDAVRLQNVQIETDPTQPGGIPRK